MKLLVVRDVIAARFTLGQLFVDGVKFCETLEDPVRELDGVPVHEWKVYGDTAIPRGTYRVVIDHSPKFGRDMLHVLDVPGYVGIRLHGANTVNDILGCIGVGTERRANGIGNCKGVLTRLEKTVAGALAAGDSVSIEVQ